MEGSSKVILGGAVITVATLAIVLGLVLVLLAELYCSLFLRRRRLRTSTASLSTIPELRLRHVTPPCHHNHTKTTTSSGSQSRSLSELLREDSRTSSLASFHQQGVIQASRRFLFPSFHSNDKPVDMEKQQESPPFSPLASPKTIPIDSDEICGGSNRESYIYICNPIYDTNRANRVVDTPPFGTPDSSPSRLDEVGSSGLEEEEEEDDIVGPMVSCPSSSESGPPMTPPLTPMKKLPAEAVSVCLREAGSIATTVTGSVSSLSSSVSPGTSHSW